MMRYVLSWVSFFLAVVSAYMFYDRYWQYKDLFNGEGRYFDSATGVVTHAQSGMVWGGLSAFLFFAAFLFVYARR